LNLPLQGSCRLQGGIIPKASVAGFRFWNGLKACFERCSKNRSTPPQEENRNWLLELAPFRDHADLPFRINFLNTWKSGELFIYFPDLPG